MKLREWLQHGDKAGASVQVDGITVTCSVDGMDPWEYQRAVDGMERALSPWLDCEIE